MVHKSRFVGIGAVTLLACSTPLHESADIESAQTVADGGAAHGATDGATDAAIDGGAFEPEAATEAASDARDANALDARDAPEGSAEVTVTVGGPSGMGFFPSDVTIQVGQTVHWVWSGTRMHNVVSGTPDGTADNRFCSPNDTNCANAPLSPPGTTYDHTFTQTGTYSYFCAPHVLFGMTGTITVVAQN
jgi:plastocyanin